MRKKTIENILGEKRRKYACDQHFLLLPQNFLPYQKEVTSFSLNSLTVSAFMHACNQACLRQSESVRTTTSTFVDGF